MTLLDECYRSFVNLDSRPDRLDHMTQELARVGLRATRTRGPLPSEWLGDPARVETILSRTPGALGCWMGQTAVMWEALRRGQHAFVMEDDLRFCSDFHERLAIIEEFLSAEPWDVFWLGGTYHVNPAVWHKDTIGRDAQRTRHPRIVRTYGAFSTFAYFVNRDSIAAVLRGLDARLPYSVGIDTTFIDIQPFLHAYAFVPGCVKQVDGRSDIGDGDTIFSGFAKLGPHWWADRLEQFDPETYDWAEAAL